MSVRLRNSAQEKAIAGPGRQAAVVGLAAKRKVELR